MKPMMTATLLFLISLAGCTQPDDSTEPSPGTGTNSAEVIVVEEDGSLAPLEAAARRAFEATISQCGECSQPAVCEKLLVDAMHKNQETILHLSEATIAPSEGFELTKEVEKRFEQLGKLAEKCEAALAKQTPP